MRFSIISCFLLVLLILILILSACQPSAQTPTAALVVEDAWVRAMPPGRKMTAAYGVFRNSGAVVLRINDFSSPQYASVSLHETIVDSSGMSRMQEIQELLIPPGELFVLEPGSKHLMLMGKHNNPAEEKTNSVTIVFSLEKPRRIEFRVK
ncbi:MAG: copper chaperone PCu(A)C [Xanthomonadales bacterium]|nr:copper chaperone PCu(A)C [Xanthomonadales bacterium]